MVPWNPATVAFPFGAADQAKGERHLLAGELTLAQNVRMVKEDEWRKRPGFDRTVCSTFVGGTPSGTPKEYALVGGSDIWRDGSDQVWSREPDANTAYLRGKQQRAFPTHFTVNRNAPSNYKPLTVLAGGDLWVFQRETYATLFGEVFWSITVYDATTKVMKQAPLTYSVQALGSVPTIDSWSAAYDSANGYIWLMIVGSSTRIESYRFTVSSPSTTPTMTAYRVVAGEAFNCIDIKKLSNGEFLVAASSFTTPAAHRCYFEHSYLNPATGAAKVAPGAAGVVTAPTVPNPRCCTGVRILNYDAANGTVYYAIWRTKAGVANTVQLMLIEVSTTTLSVTASVELATESVTQTANPIVGVCSGYRNPSSGDRIVYAQIDINDTPTPGVLKITRYTYNGATTAFTVVARQAVLLSDPFNQGASTEFFFVTGYDDGQTSHAQRTYFLRNQDGGIISQFMPGEGSAAWYQSVGRDSGGGAYTHFTGFVNAPVNPASSKWMVAVAAEDSANETTLVNVVELDFSETYAPPVAIDDIVVFNGPVPQVAGPRDDLHDLSPLLFPALAPTFSLGAGAALGTFRVCYRYRFQDSSGRFYRSASSATASAAFLTTGRTVVVQTMQHIGKGVVAIEIYGSVADGTDMYLQTVAWNDLAADTVAWPVTPERWGTAGELLDTAGGALSPAPTPASRCAALWRGRLHLSGCADQREIWSSKEMQPGRGPEFNEALVTEWLDGIGAPEVLQACDWNYLSAHKADGTVGVLSGPGPDGRGSGGYTVLTLSGAKAARVGSAATGPAGCYFQNVQDGRICLLPPGSPAVDIGRGVESYRATNVVAALHVESERSVWFFLSDGKVLVLNYAFPTASSPSGRWSVTSGPSLAAVGAAMNGTAPRYLEASSTIGFRSPGAAWVDANAAGNADVLTKISLSKLRPAGHQQEFMVDRGYFEGQHLGSSNLRITITNDIGQTEQFTKTGTASPLDYMVTPGAQTLRTKEFGVSIEETASTTEGFVYDTFAADIKTVGKIKVPNAGNWIAPG
jgi:hypothetical protein